MRARGKVRYIAQQTFHGVHVTFFHEETLLRRDVEIVVRNEPRGPYGEPVAVVGEVCAGASLVRLDDSGAEIVLGLAVVDPQSGEAIAEYRHAFVDVTDVRGATFQAYVRTDRLRPKAYTLRVQLLIDGVAWFGEPAIVPLQIEQSPAFMDVQALIASYSVEELCQSAENYFKHYEEHEGLHDKPYDVINVQHSLAAFSFMVRGLQLQPGMSVIDFGSGPGWATRLFSRIGMEVYSCDVSATALKLSEKLNVKELAFKQLLPIRSVHFNGRVLDISDSSVDRVACFAALHHVPNLEQTLIEIARVLKPGGRAGFEEPGRHHSLSPESQSEMRTFKVVENDVDLEEINRLGMKAGFKPIEVMLQNTLPDMTGLSEYLSLASGSAAADAYLRSLLERKKWAQMFFFEKG